MQGVLLAVVEETENKDIKHEFHVNSYQAKNFYKKIFLCYSSIMNHEINSTG